MAFRDHASLLSDRASIVSERLNLESSGHTMIADFVRFQLQCRKILKGATVFDMKERNCLVIIAISTSREPKLGESAKVRSHGPSGFRLGLACFHP